MAKRVTVVVIILLLACAALFVLDSQWLVLDKIEVTGCQLLDQDQIKSYIGLECGQPMLRIRTSVVRQNIQSIPYVEKATVKRIWPDTLQVTIVERSVAGCMAWGEGLALLDVNGCVLELRQTLEDAHLPCVLNLTVEDAIPGQKLKMKDRKEIEDKEIRQEQLEFEQLKLDVACQSLAALKNQNAMGLIDTIDVGHPSELVMQTREGIRVLFGLPTGLEEKAAWLAQVLPQIRKEGHRSGTLDVSIPGEVVFSPEGEEPEQTPLPEQPAESPAAA
nr:FtsQ-type POTRA domain-containing protein [bacterium]